MSVISNFQTSAKQSDKIAVVAHMDPAEVAELDAIRKRIAKVTDATVTRAGFVRLAIARAIADAETELDGSSDESETASEPTKATPTKAKAKASK